MNNRHIFGTILALVVYMFANGFAMPSRPCYQGPSDADSNNRINTRVSGDHSPPTITISVSAPTGENGWYNEPIFVRVNALDEGSGKVITQVSLGGYRWYDDALKIATDGEFMIVAKATDRSGNTSRVTKIVKLDMTPPEVFLKVPEPEGLDNYHIGIVPIVITGTDNLSGVVDSGVEANGSAHFIGKNATIATARVSITESGSYRVEGYVKDEAGNRTEITTDLMIDLDTPEVTITSPKEYNNDIHISGSAIDKESGIKRVLVDYGDGWSLISIKDHPSP